MRQRKGWKIVYSLVNRANIVLEVVDARFPQKTRCEHLEQIVADKDKHLILCLNKADLIPKVIASKWKLKFNPDFPTIFMSARDRLGTKILRNSLKHASRKNNNIVAIVGFPNTGKSSVVNILKGRHSASTAATPGWTKHGQLFRISKTMVIYDTPGVLPFEGSEEDHVLYGGYPVDKLEDPMKYASELFEQLNKQDPTVIHKKYNLTTIGAQFFEDLAKTRGRLLPGAVPDVEQVAREFLREFVDGKIPYWENP